MGDGLSSRNEEGDELARSVVKEPRKRINRRARKVALAVYGRKQSGRQWVRLRKELRQMGLLPEGYL